MRIKTVRNILIFILGIAIIGASIFWWTGKTIIDTPSQFLERLADGIEYTLKKIPGEQSTFTQFKAKGQSIHQ